MKNHEKDTNIILSFRDCLPLLLRVSFSRHIKTILNTNSLILLKNIKQSVADDDDNEELQKCLKDIAEIAPKYLKSCLDDVFELCISVSL